MIENGFAYLSVLVMIASFVVYLDRGLRLQFFDYLPAIVVIYFVVMVLSTFGLWQKNSEINHIYTGVKSNILPAMIFLMLLSADLRKIKDLGGKMLLTFFLASFSIAMGFVVMFLSLHSYFEAGTWGAFAALCGSWMGGTANMIAIQGALNVPDSKMGYILLIDSIDYAIWVMVLLALVPFAAKFNQWSRADTSLIDETVKKLNDTQNKAQMSFHSLFLLLGIALVVSALSQYSASLMPVADFVTEDAWVVIIATLFGIFCAVTPISRLGGSDVLGSIFLYMIVSLIASRADFSELGQAPLYVFSGAVVIAIHAVLMTVFARLFRLDLFSIAVASLANIGGIASAPILAGAYSQALIPIGVLMAMMGYIIGTFGGLMVGKILMIIGG